MDVLAQIERRLTNPNSNLPPFARFEVFASPGGSDDLTRTTCSTRACSFERVANEVDNAVSVIDKATNMVVETVPTGDDPRGVAVTPDGKQTCHPAEPWRRRTPLA